MYLIPANSKRGMLIFGLFRPVDLILFLSGVGLTIFLVILTNPGTLLQTFVVLTPVGICAMLVAPIPNYHNVLVFVQSMVKFLTNRQKYVWKGWCYYERKTEED